MIWLLILVIVVVGLLIVAAINRNTTSNALIAEQQRLNSPEYRNQERASLDYFRHLGDIDDCKIRIAENSIAIFDPPKYVAIFKDPKTGKDLDGMHYLTQDKETYAQGKKDGMKVRLVSRNEIVDILKRDIANDKNLIKELEAEYKDRQKEYPGYHPEDLDTIKTKYELDAPFPVRDDYFNEDNTSSWSMYEERKTQLHDLEKQLKKRHA